jgi:hypothetical protein
MRAEILIILLIVLSVSCEYSPDDTLIREITPVEIPVDISLDNINPKDTVYLGRKTDFICTISHEEHQVIYQTDILMDETVLMETFNSYRIEFFIDPKEFPVGVHRLKVKCISSSGARSIADVLGYEKYSTETFWIIKIIRDSP